MAEKEIPVITVGVDYVCDQCQQGIMIQNGPINLKDIEKPMYPHTCNNCGHQQEFAEKYPTVRHKRVS